MNVIAKTTHNAPKSANENERIWLSEMVSHFDNLLRTNHEKTLEEFTEIVICELCLAVQALQGAFYVVRKDADLYEFRAGYGCTFQTAVRTAFKIGEGTVGQAIKLKRTLCYDIPKNSLWVETGLGKIEIRQILLLPLVFNQKVYGLIELQKHIHFQPEHFELFDILSRNLAPNLQAIQNYQTIKELFDDLLSQHQLLVENEEKLRVQSEFIAQKNEELQHSNSLILDSIRYARRIQHAILSNEKELHQNFREAFLISRPKDIVSGDFFWTKAYKNKIFLVCADCTGHGVAGALMTIVGTTLLDHIVGQKNVHNPAKILNSLSIGIQTALRQDDDHENQTDDGMDLMLLVFHQEKHNEIQLDYSGAKSTAYLISNYQIQELRGDKIMIGVLKQSHKEFETQTVFLQKNDMVYLRTDGIIDQSDKSGKKFGSVRLKAVLLEHHQKDLVEQKTLFEDTIDNFQGRARQRDDMMLIGVKV